MQTIGILDFVKRQTRESRHDHFEGSWEELIALTESQWEHRRVSPNNPGVLLVPMPECELHRFYSSTVTVTPDSRLNAFFAPRVEGEAPYIQVIAENASKTPARAAEIILYSHETLAADGDAPPTREADYYIVSINAYPTPEPSPMSPMTMARNFLGLKGGTRPPVPYTAEDFARSIVYWSQHVHAGSYS
ncbi:MAG TPA: DUF3228 family protein [Oculatellaceae cyanobacterium]